MPTNKTATVADDEVLTGPADTADASVRVTSTKPDESDLRSGTKPATTELPTSTVLPLKLIGEPRIETYETVAPNGTIVEVTHNLDTGEASYNWTDRRAAVLAPADAET